MNEYVDVDIIENGKKIGTFKCLHKTEEKKDEMKNKISMALKDPILQQGFEVICKENAELKEKLETIRNYLAYKVPHELINEATNKIWKMI